MGRPGFKTQYTKQDIIENYFQYQTRRSIKNLWGFDIPCNTIEDFVAIHWRGRKSKTAYEKILVELGIDLNKLAHYLDTSN